jgi:putative zinc finger protein
MDCERVKEILPWLLNGTLSAAEQQMARAHLAQCQDCQQELQETAFAIAVHKQHPSEQALVDYAFDRPVGGPERDLIESHLASCAECSEQLGLAEQSRLLMKAEDNVVTFQPRPRATEAAPAPRRSMWLWQSAAAAATIIGFVALAGLWWNWQQAKELRGALTEEQRARQEQVAKLQEENEQLRQAPKPSETTGQTDGSQQEIARLQARVKELSAPQVNIPVLEVFPQELAERTGRDRVNQLQIPRFARAITLILNSQSASEGKKLSLEILDAGQKVVYGQQGVVRHSTGDYTVSVPTEFLPPGDYTFNIYGEAEGKRAKIESYRIRINKR